MARKLRVEFAGACYHVINRGNYRRDLFMGEGAAASFESCLFEASAAFGWRLHAFVIMSNHFHLAVETPEPNLSIGMKWLQGTWVTRFNRFRGIVGRPFQGRYHALHVEPGHALAQVAHYIHLNPVRAGLRASEDLLGYEWSSLPRFVSTPRPPCLEVGTVLHESGALPDTPEGWRRYVDYLGVIGEEELALREKRFGRFSRGWVIGSDSFRQELQAQFAAQPGLEERFQLLGADRAAQDEARSALWEAQLIELAEKLAVDLATLPTLKSAEQKVRLASAMKTTTSVSNRWLADRLQMGKASGVATLVRRFRNKRECDAKACLHS